MSSLIESDGALIKMFDTLLTRFPDQRTRTAQDFVDLTYDSPDGKLKLFDCNSVADIYDLYFKMIEDVVPWNRLVDVLLLLYTLTSDCSFQSWKRIR